MAVLPSPFAAPQASVRGRRGSGQYQKRMLPCLNCRDVGGRVSNMVAKKREVLCSSGAVTHHLWVLSVCLPHDLRPVHGGEVYTVQCRPSSVHVVKNPNRGCSRKTMQGWAAGLAGAGRKGQTRKQLPQRFKEQGCPPLRTR